MSERIGTASQSRVAHDDQCKNTHSIEIELSYGDSGEPAAWKNYSVTFPDGVQVHGFLDGNGFARVGSLESPADA